MSPSPFECNFPGCGLSYRRKEHLTRHAKSHFKIQALKCPFCDRSFARNDTLRHHVRSHHQDKVLKTSRSPRACNYCRARRSKCDGQHPCDRCSRLGKDCSYPERSGPERTTMDRERECSRANSSSLLRSEGMEHSPCRAAPYIQAYFDVFHPKWPFLHPATFHHTHEPALLLQSVAMMGMWVTTEKNAQDTAKALHDNLILCIDEQKGHWASLEGHEGAGDDPKTHLSDSTTWPLATFQGILLQIIFSLLQNQDPFDLGFTSDPPEIHSQLLRALVHNCRKRNMFFYPSMLSQFHQGEHPEVFIWVGVEELKRFALSLYRVCQRTRLHDTVPRELEDVPDHSDRGPSRLDKVKLLSLADLRFALPDSDELWHMTSGLADQLAGRSVAYADANKEEHWICQAARLLQPRSEQFRWI